AVAQVFRALEADAAARQNAAQDALELAFTVLAVRNASVSHTVDGDVRLRENRSRNEAGNSQRDQFLLHLFLLKYEVETAVESLALLTSLARSWIDCAKSDGGHASLASEFGHIRADLVALL